MANAWTPSPSPLGALASESPAPPSAVWVGWHVAATLPHRLWDAYIAYLVYYQPDSWVGRVASTFRLLAVVLVLPVVLLTLLDVSSYVIARTLGVVDHVKASTSDAEPAVVSASTVSMSTGTSTSASAEGRQKVAVSAVAARACSLSHGVIGPETLASEDMGAAESRTISVGADGDGHGHSSVQTETEMEVEIEVRCSATDPGRDQGAPSHACYFAGEDDLQRLAGEDVFSVPPSPLASRMPLHAFTSESDSDGQRTNQASGEDGIVLRRRAAPNVRAANRDHS